MRMHTRSSDVLVFQIIVLHFNSLRTTNLVVPVDVAFPQVVAQEVIVRKQTLLVLISCLFVKLVVGPV